MSRGRNTNRDHHPSTSADLCMLSLPAFKIVTMTTKPASIDIKTLVEQGYDKVAAPYLAWSAPRPTVTRIQYLNKLVENLPPGSKILELGCGAGVPCLQMLVERGLDVTGVDISQAQIDLARQHVPKAKLIKSDMAALQFEPQSFDAVVAFYSLFHLPKEEQLPMIQRIEGWLKEGGHFLCNLQTEEGDSWMQGWLDPSVNMFSSGLGVTGNREMFAKMALKVTHDEVAVENVGSQEISFHWVMAVSG